MKKEVITAFFAASILTFSAMNYTSFAAESLSYAQTVKPRSKAGIFVDVEYCKRCNLD